MLHTSLGLCIVLLLPATASSAFLVTSSAVQVDRQVATDAPSVALRPTSSGGALHVIEDVAIYNSATATGMPSFLSSSLSGIAPNSTNVVITELDDHRSDAVRTSSALSVTPSSSGGALLLYSRGKAGSHMRQDTKAQVGVQAQQLFTIDVDNESALPGDTGVVRKDVSQNAASRMQSLAQLGAGARSRWASMSKSAWQAFSAMSHWRDIMLGSYGSVQENCQHLKTTPGPALGNRLERTSTGKIGFKVGAMPAVPVHLIYRFTGKSRHDPNAFRIPSLSAVSLVQALQATSLEHRQHITAHIVLNGDAAHERLTEYDEWFSKQFRELSLANISILKAPSGNSESYSFMLKTIQRIEDVAEAMVFCLEEDYWLNRDAFTKMIEFWGAYDPCFAVPYDYPDRYTRTDDTDFGRIAILKAPDHHWRTVESATVTFAGRLDLVKQFSDLLPTPWDDRNPSRRISQDYGIWAPIPSVASHVHMDDHQPCGALSDLDFDCHAIIDNLCKAAIGLGFPFIATEVQCP